MEWRWRQPVALLTTLAVAEHGKLRVLKVVPGAWPEMGGLVRSDKSGKRRPSGQLLYNV
jgi:hypothetical protein